MQNIMLVPACKSTTMRKVIKAHGLQFLEVNIEYGGEVPLHTHDCAATMVVTRGSARKITGNGLGERIKAGDVISKGPKEPHGFTDIGKQGFQFISISDHDGIVHEDKSLDMAFV